MRVPPSEKLLAMTGNQPADQPEPGIPGERHSTVIIDEATEFFDRYPEYCVSKAQKNPKFMVHSPELAALFEYLRWTKRGGFSASGMAATILEKEFKKKFPDEYKLIQDEFARRTAGVGTRKFRNRKQDKPELEKFHISSK